MKTKIFALSAFVLLLIAAVYTKNAFAGVIQKTLTSYDRYDRLQDADVNYVEPLNGYISFTASAYCSSNPSDYSSAQTILWGDFYGLEANLYVPDNGTYSKSASGTIYPYSTAGGWAEYSLYANGAGSSASVQINW